jgi:hypothetical protein
MEPIIVAANNIRPTRCCSFCRVPGHCKPRCEKYKVFVKIHIFFLNVFSILFSILDPNRVPFTETQIQKIFWEFYGNPISIINLKNMSNDVFEDYILTNQIAFVEEVMRRIRAQEERRVIHEVKQGPTICLELCVNKSKTVVECGICLSDDIPCYKMVKLGCGHEFCGDCAENMVNAKPCCAFCRADVQKVSVGSKSVLSKLKKNKKFVVY